MAFMTKDIIDLKGILLSMLLIIPSIAPTNIDCNGKAFRCVNSTHFMICVDLGTGKSTTIDDFVMRCPLTTVCRPTNRFECEFPSPITVTTEATLTEITTATDKGLGTDAATLSPGVAVSVPFEEYLNTISVTTVSEFDLSSTTTEIGNDVEVSTDSDAYYKSNVENNSIVIPYQATDIHDQELTTTMSNFPPEMDITDKPILYESTGNESHSDNSLIATDKIVTEELFADGFRNNPEITTTNYIIPEVVSPKQDGIVTKGSLEIRNTSNVSKSDDLLIGGDTNETNSYKDAKLNIEPMGDTTTTVMLDTTITALKPNSDLVNESTTVLTPSAPTEFSVLSTESNGNTSQSDNSLIATEKIVTEELFADGFSNNPEITTTKYIIPEVVSRKQDGFVTIGSLEIRNTTNVSNSDDLLMGGDTNETKSYKDAQLNQEAMGDITTTVMLETTITVLKPNSNLVNESTTILTPSTPTESSVLSTESNGNTSQSDTSLISMEQTVTEELFTDVFQPESTTINYFPEFISPKEDGFVTVESPVEIINIPNVSKSDDPPVSGNNINTDSSYKDVQLQFKPTVDTTITVMSETTITLLEPNKDLVSEATTVAAPSVTESSILSTISNGNESPRDNSLIKMEETVTEESFITDAFHINPEITTTNYVPEFIPPKQDGFVTIESPVEIINITNVSKSDDPTVSSSTNDTDSSYKDVQLQFKPTVDTTITVMSETTITLLEPNKDLVSEATTVAAPSVTESSILSTISNGNESPRDNSLIKMEETVTEESFITETFHNNPEITTTNYVPEFIPPKQDGFVTIESPVEIINITNVSKSDDPPVSSSTIDTDRSYKDAHLNLKQTGDTTTTVMSETTITLLEPKKDLVSEATTVAAPSVTDSSILSTISNGNQSPRDNSLIKMEETVTEESFITETFHNNPEITTTNYVPEFIPPKQDGFVTIESPVEIINITNVSKSDDPPVSSSTNDTDRSYKDAHPNLKQTGDTTTTVMSETTITLLEPKKDLVSEATTVAAPSVTDSSILSTISNGNESPRDNSLIKMEETVTEESFITETFHNNPEITTTNYVPEFIPPKQDGFVTIESPVEIINITNVSKSDDPPVSSSTIDTDRSYKDAHLNLKQTGDTTNTVTLDTTITVLEPNSDLVHETTTLLTPSVTTESSMLTTIISTGNKSPNVNNLIKMEETPTEASFTEAFRNNPESTTTNHDPEFILPKQDGFVTIESPVEIINITYVSKSDDPSVSGNTINTDSNYKDAQLNLKPTVDTTTTVMSETTNTVLEPNSDLVSESTTVAAPNVAESSILSTINNTNEILRDNSLINMEETVTEESFTDALPNNPENITNNNVPEFILLKQDGFVTIESPVEIINITNVSKSDDPPVSSSTIDTDRSYKDAQLNLKQTGDNTTTVMLDTTITVLEPNNDLVSEATTVAAPSVTESFILSTISNVNESPRDNSLIEMEETVTEKSFITETFHNNPENTTTNYVAEFILPKQDGFVTIESPVEIINITNVLKSDDPPLSGNTIETGSSYKDAQLNLKPTGDTTTTMMLDTTIDVLGSNTDLVYKTTTVLTPSVSIESPIISTDSNDWAAVTTSFTEGSTVIYNKKLGSTGVIQKTSTNTINDLDNNHTLKTNNSLGFIMINDDNVPFLTNDKYLETVTTSYVEMTTATIPSEDGNEHVTNSADIDVVTSDIHTLTKNEIITAKLNTQNVTDTTTSPNIISNIGLNISEANKIMFVATSAYSELITKEEDEMFITDTPRILVTSTESAKTEEISTEENLTFAQTETTENSNSGNKIMEHKTPVKDLETLTNSYSVTTNNLEMATESSVREQDIDGQNIYTIINEKSSTNVPILNEKVLSNDDLNRNVETQTYTETLSGTTDSHVFSNEVEIISSKTSEAPVLITTDLYLVQEPQLKEKERETKTSLEDLSTLGDRSITNTATISVIDIELNNESSLIDIQSVTSDPQSTSLDINIFKTTNNFPVESETITKDSISEELDIISKNIVNESSATQVINVVDRITTPAPLVSIIHKNVDEEKAGSSIDITTNVIDVHDAFEKYSSTYSTTVDKIVTNSAELFTESDAKITNVNKDISKSSSSVDYSEFNSNTQSHQLMENHAESTTTVKLEYDTITHQDASIVKQLVDTNAIQGIKHLPDNQSNTYNRTDWSSSNNITTATTELTESLNLNTETNNIQNLHDANDNILVVLTVSTQSVTQTSVQRNTQTLMRKDDNNLQETTQSMYRAGNNFVRNTTNQFNEDTIVKDERNIIPIESSPPIETHTMSVDISSDLIIERASTPSILDLTTSFIDPGTNATKINILKVTTPKLQDTSNGELYDKVPESETQSIEISTRDYSQITTPPVYTTEQNQFAIVKTSSDNLYPKVQSTERSDVTISELSTSLDNLSVKVLDEAAPPEITTDKHYNSNIAPIDTNNNRSLVTDKETNPKINSESKPYTTDHERSPTKENNASIKNTIAVNESDPRAVTEQYIRTQTDIWNDTISEINKQYTESIVTSSESSSPPLVHGGINVKSIKDEVNKNPNGASLDLTVTTDDTADIIIENIPVKQTHSGMIALKAETLNDHNRKTQEEGEVEGRQISTRNEKEIHKGEKEEQMTLSQNANFDRIRKPNIANSQVEKPSTHELIEDSPMTESYTTNNRPKDQNKKDNDQSRAESLPSTNSNVGNEQTTEFLMLQSTTSKPNPSLYDCTHKRGRHADRQDCRKFYVCLGNGHIIVGTCPVNTVFSEIRKQCTNNLSHCIINNQFQCLTEGHFIDYFNDSMYYICVKNGSSFIRFKLQCLNGYHLDKTIVRCSLNTESDQSDSNSDSNSTRNSKSDSNRTSNSKSETSESSPSVQEENVKSEKQFKCEKSGKFPDVSNPRRYFECTKKDGKYRQKKKKCRDDKIFDVDKKTCICIDSDASNESR